MAISVFKSFISLKYLIIFVRSFLNSDIQWGRTGADNKDYEHVINIGNNPIIIINRGINSKR